ncbi:hypothetical protein JCM10450v2_002156 [Rhodotorula kratochvilovae]
MLRLSSYGASATTSHGYPKSPLAPAEHPPTEAYPPPPAARSSDILINRSHELKRIAKGVATFYQGIAEAHNTHALTLKKLSAPATTPIPTPFAEASLFIPLPSSASPTTPASLGGNGSEGWAQILQEARDTNARTADAHAELAKSITKDVVGPLLRCRIDMKAHIQVMERDLTKAVDAVQKERDIAAPILARLSTSLTQSSLPAAAPSLAPAEDPVLLRAQVEGQLRAQVARENELLAVVKTWVERTEQKEKDILGEIKRCWAVWEQANSNMLLGNQQLSMFLSATVDSVPPEAEWAHFLRLNHIVLPDVADKTLDGVLWDGKGDPLTTVVLEGMLERQTSFLRSWKPAYFILTPSGHLHIYGPPPASAVPAASSTEDSGDTDSASLSSTPAYPPLSPTASYLLLHTSPHLSLNLALCTLGPMPTPEKALPEAEERKKAPLDAVFTVIESLGKGGKGEGSGTKHVVRCRGERGWEEMGGWVAAIGKFCATPTAPPPPSPPTPTPAAPSTFAARAPSPSPSAASDAPPAPPAAQRTLPPIAPRTLPPLLPARGESPALPSLPTSPLSTASSTVAPPLPPRDSMLSTASSASFVADDGEDGDGDGDTTRNSVLVIEDDYDLSRAMSGLGVMGALAEPETAEDVQLAQEPERDLEEEDAPAPPAKPEDEEVREEDDGQDSASGSDAGDLGRSLSGSSLSRAAFGNDAPAGATIVGRKERSPRQGSVRSLAAAWEQQQGVPAGAGKEKEEQEAEGAEEEGKDEEDEEKPVVGKGKKGKKKRKSKGGAAANEPTERPLPLPSIDPEHADLGLPSPHSPSFGATPAPFEADGAHAREGVASPPPMVLEEVEESPSRGSEDGGARTCGEEKEDKDGKKDEA